VRERHFVGRDQKDCERERDLEVCTVLQLPTPAQKLTLTREDDTKWPQKNKDGRQELEIRIGNDHISFEVSPRSFLSNRPR